MTSDSRIAGLNWRFRDLYLSANRSVSNSITEKETVHEDFRRSIQDILSDLDIPESERQLALTSMSCPCCGGSGISVFLELKTSDSARF